jgi:hypothetical protein
MDKPLFLSSSVGSPGNNYCWGNRDVPAINKLFDSSREGIRAQWSLPSGAAVLCNSALHSLLPCGLGTEDEGCPVCPKIPSTSPQTDQNILPIHHSVHTLQLVTSIYMACSRSTLKGNTSDVMKWKFKRAGGCKHFISSLWESNMWHIIGMCVSIGLTSIWRNKGSIWWSHSSDYKERGLWGCNAG